MNLKGHNVLIENGSIKLMDSCLVNKRDFRPTIEMLRKRFPDNVVLKNRTDKSISIEWAVHNLCYNWGIFRSRTRDVDFNFPVKWYEKIGYPIIGKLCMWLIR